jgi:hypothetical protein
VTARKPSPAVRRAVGVLWRAPGSRLVRRRVVRTLRSSPTARRLAQQVFAVRPAQGGIPVDVSAGALLGGLGTEQLPVALVLLVGTPPDAVGAVVQEVAELQVLSASFRPVFVLDSPTFGPVRRYGYPVELVIRRDEWTDPATSWEEYLTMRITSIQNHFQSTGMVRVGPQGLDEVDRAVLSGGR